MKKRIALVLLLLIIAIYQLKLAYSQSGVGIGLQIIDISGPTVNLIVPLNNSGDADGNITFSYNVSDDSILSNCSLIINGKINITDSSITKNTRLSITVNNSAIGAYNWSINCTDASGFVGVSDNRTFSVFFMTNFNGSTTNVSSIDIRNVTNFVVQTPAFGKINFSENVDLSRGFDLDKYLSISSNRIELNSTALPDLNKSATLEIVGLTFSNPRILRDGAVCPSSICTKVSYSGGALIFNVTQFTAYSSEETPAEAGTSGGGGGGGSGATGGGGGGGGGSGAPLAIPIKTDFTTDKTTIRVTLKQGQTKEETLSIKNTGTTIFDIKTYLQGIEKFKVSPEVAEIINTLNPEEEKTIKFVFKALENEKPDIYTGKIILKGPSVEKEVNALIEVDSAEPLFDVDVEVLPDSKNVFPGEELSLEANLFNVRGFGRVDVVVEYSIKDFNGNVLATEHETLAVETQAKFVRRILVPSDLKPGTYAIFAKVNYADSVGVSSDLFEVKAKTIRLLPIQIKDYKIILLFGVVILTVAIFVFSAYKIGYLKKKLPKTKAEEVEQLKEEDKSQKLKKELSALESGYKSGFISKEAYQRGKKRIEDKLRGLM